MKNLRVEGPILPGSVVVTWNTPAPDAAFLDKLVDELAWPAGHRQFLVAEVTDDGATLKVLNVEEWLPAVMGVLRPEMERVVRDLFRQARAHAEAEEPG